MTMFSIVEAPVLVLPSISVKFWVRIWLFLISFLVAYCHTLFLVLGWVDLCNEIGTSFYGDVVLNSFYMNIFKEGLDFYIDWTRNLWYLNPHNKKHDVFAFHLICSNMLSSTPWMPCLMFMLSKTSSPPKKCPDLNASHCTFSKVKGAYRKTLQPETPIFDETQHKLLFACGNNLELTWGAGLPNMDQKGDNQFIILSFATMNRLGYRMLFFLPTYSRLESSPRLLF